MGFFDRLGHGVNLVGDDLHPIRPPDLVEGIFDQGGKISGGGVGLIGLPEGYFIVKEHLVPLVVGKSESVLWRQFIFMVNKEFFVLVDEGYGAYSGPVKLLFKGGNPSGDNSGRDSFEIENCQRNGNEGTFDTSLPVTMHTSLSGSSNIMYVTYPETTDGYDSNWTAGYFSDELAERTQRRNYEVCQTKPADDAVRFITVLYPYGAASEYENIDITASFTDSGFSESGTRVRVTVDNNGSQETYNLSYTINQ